MTASAITEKEREPGCRSACHCRRRACVAALLTSPKLHLRVRAYAKMPSLAVFCANTTCLWRGNSAASASLPVPKSSQGCLRANTRTPKALLQMMNMRICAYAHMRVCAYVHMRITQSHHDRKRRPQHARASASNLLADASSKHWVHFCCCTDVLNRPSSSLGCLS